MPLGKRFRLNQAIAAIVGWVEERNPTHNRLVRESLSFSKKMENHVGEPFGILSMTTMDSKAKD